MQKTVEINFLYKFRLKYVKNKKAVFISNNLIRHRIAASLFLISSIVLFTASISIGDCFLNSVFFLVLIISFFWYRSIKKKSRKQCFFDMKNNIFQLADNSFEDKPKKIIDIKNLFIIAINIKFSSMGRTATGFYNRECYQVNFLMKDGCCYNFSTFLNYYDAFEAAVCLSDFTGIEFNDLHISGIMNKLDDTDINNFYKFQLKHYNPVIQKSFKRYIEKERSYVKPEKKPVYFCPNCGSGKCRLARENSLLSNIIFKVSSYFNKKYFIKDLQTPNIIDNNKIDYEIFIHNCFCCGTELNLKNIVQTPNT